MRSVLITSIMIFFLYSNTFAQTQRDLNINFMLRGQIYAESYIKDTLAFGGFGGSDNLPQLIYDTLNFSGNGLFLKIDESKIVTFENEFNGYKFYICNKSDSIVKLNASDSRLYAIAEVYYRGKWKPIEYLPSSFCGNSYHNVYLGPNEYWSFEIPKFSGKKKVKLRYSLKVGKTEYIYSNEIITKINKGQMKNKKQYNPNGIMDPYRD